MTDHSLSRAESLGLTQSFSGLRRLATNWMKRRRLYKVYDLDDHLLDDIGYSREEVFTALHLPLTVDPVWDLNRRAQARRTRGRRGR